MKRVFWLLLITVVLLVGCISRNLENQKEADGGGSSVADPPAGTEPPTTDGKEDTTGAPDSEQLAYYVEVIAQLQEELLSLRSSFYAEKVRYEEQIRELEALLGEENTSASSASFSYTVENGSAMVTGYLGKESTVVIPSELGGYPVRAIGDGAFRDATSIRSIVLPQGIERIGWFAFSGCIALVEVSIPLSVDEIGYGAFLNCSASLCVACSIGSYAEQYAQSYGLKTSTNAAG